MSAYKMLNWRDRTADSVEQTVAAFLEIGEAVATRWIKTAKGVLLLQMVPDNGASGAIYVFDREREQWYMLSFEGCEAQFTSEKFDRAFTRTLPTGIESQRAAVDGIGTSRLSPAI